MYVNLFFNGLSNSELLTFKTGPPCITVYFRTFDEISVWRAYNNNFLYFSYKFFHFLT